MDNVSRFRSKQKIKIGKVVLSEESISNHISSQREIPTTPIVIDRIIRLSVSHYLAVLRDTPNIISYNERLNMSNVKTLLLQQKH
jgi:hypothetical protein